MAAKRRYCDTKKCDHLVDSQIIVGNMKHSLCYSCLVHLHGDLQQMLYGEEEEGTEMIDWPDVPLDLSDLVEGYGPLPSDEEPQEKRTESGIILA
jgi:hypothetical protein